MTVPGFEFTVIGIDSATGEPAELGGEGVVPYIALVPLGVTVDNIMETVIADGFRTIEEICEGDVAETRVLPGQRLTTQKQVVLTND